MGLEGANVFSGGEGRFRLFTLTLGFFYFVNFWPIMVVFLVTKRGIPLFGLKGYPLILTYIRPTMAVLLFSKLTTEIVDHCPIDPVQHLHETYETQPGEQPNGATWKKEVPCYFGYKVYHPELCASSHNLTNSSQHDRKSNFDISNHFKNSGIGN